MRTLSCLALACLIATPAFAQSKSWAPLSLTERDNLAVVLSKVDPANITIACASERCADLAADVAGLFHSARWKVSKINHGGIGIDGVQGLRVSGCGVNPQKLHDAVEATTSRSIEVVTEKDCFGDPEIYLVIGEPSF